MKDVLLSYLGASRDIDWQTKTTIELSVGAPQALDIASDVEKRLAWYETILATMDDNNFFGKLARWYFRRRVNQFKEFYEVVKNVNIFLTLMEFSEGDEKEKETTKPN